MNLPIDTTDKEIPHPAPFRDEHLKVARDLMANHDKDFKTILDPFAGIGVIHKLRDFGYETYGIEREPEWVTSPYTIQGDTLDLYNVLRWANLAPSFDVCITSPTWGNRMADHHEAKDPSHRMTYRHYLGRPITEGSSSIMQWGSEYRRFHEMAWEKVSSVIDHMFILNIKDHIRQGERQLVTDFHVDTLVRLGWIWWETRIIDAPGHRFGRNYDARVPDEKMIAFVRNW